MAESEPSATVAPPPSTVVSAPGEESGVVTPDVNPPASEMTEDPTSADGNVVSTAEEPVISARTFDWDAINSEAIQSESYVLTNDLEIPLSDEDELEIDGEDLVLSDSYVATGADMFTPTAEGALAETTGLGDSFVPPPTGFPPIPEDDAGSYLSDFSDIGDMMGLEEDTKNPPPDMTVISNKEAFEALKIPGSRIVEHEGEKWIVWDENKEENEEQEVKCVHSKALSGWYSKNKDEKGSKKRIAYDLGSLWWFLEGLAGNASVDRQATEEEGYTFIDVRDRGGLIKRLRPPPVEEEVEAPKPPSAADVEVKDEDVSKIVPPPSEEEVERAPTPEPELTPAEKEELRRKKQQEADEQFEREYQREIQKEIARAQDVPETATDAVDAQSPIAIEESGDQDDIFSPSKAHTPSPGPDADDDDIIYTPSAHEDRSVTAEKSKAPEVSKVEIPRAQEEISRADKSKAAARAEKASRAERSRAAAEASAAEPSAKRHKSIPVDREMSASERAYEHFMATTWSLKVTEMRTPLSQGDNHVSDILQLARSTLKTWQEDEKRRNSKSDRNRRKRGPEDSISHTQGESTEFSTIMRNAVEPPRPAEGTRLEQLMSIHSYLGGYEHGEPPAAIIVLPNNRNALINMLNIEEFIGSSRFEMLSDGQRTLQMWSNRKRKVVFRRTVRNVPIRFEFTDGTKQFYSDEWQKVVGVLCDGQAWQFKDWPFRSHVDLFVAIQAFHLIYLNDPKPESMAKWNVKELPIQKLSRHEDPTVVDTFWEVIDDYLLGRNRINLIDMNSRLK